MKSALSVLSSVAVVFALAGCTQGPLSSAQTTDVGQTTLPEFPGYTLQGYVVERINANPDHIYFLLKDGQPVAGVTSSYQNGKSRYTVSTNVVSSTDATAPGQPLTAQISCADANDCATRVAAAMAVPQPAPFHCDSVAECETKLKQREAAQ